MILLGYSYPSDDVIIKNESEDNNKINEDQSIIEDKDEEYDYVEDKDEEESAETNTKIFNENCFR